MKKKILFFIAFLIPAFLVYKNLFFSVSPFWGDAHIVYPEGLRDFLAGPLIWMNRENNFGGIYRVISLFPLMYLRALASSYLNLSDSVSVKLLFYFPAIILSFVSPWLLAKYLKFDSLERFFASLVYGLNTYFILLIDGGQLGVALAYSFFPLVILYLKRLYDRYSKKDFIVSTFLLFVLSSIDIRLYSILIFTFVLWIFSDSLINKNFGLILGLKRLIFPVVFSLGISAFWLIPVFKLGSIPVSTNVSKLNLTSLLNSLFLFQAHWPVNEYGKIFYPSILFLGIPILLFLPVFFSKNKKVLSFVFVFLTISFLAKGETPPMGNFYTFLVDRIPLGFIFRDSSKFFVPLFIYASFLIASSVQIFRKKPILLGFVYVYLLLVISPALLGKLHGTLSEISYSYDFDLIKQRIVSQGEPFRTVWFSQIHPLAFHSEKNPSLDADSLIDKKIFSLMNVGTYDKFNFLNDPSFIYWFRNLGIKYLVFSGNPRIVLENKEEKGNWNNLLGLVSQIKEVRRVEWTNKIPIYEIKDIKKRIYQVDKMVAVIGASNLAKYSENTGFFFLEDGLVDPNALLKFPSDSLVIYFNNGNKDDLIFSFLQKYFVGEEGLDKTSWAKYPSSNYLEARYQLLIRGINTNEFEYGKGILLSTQSGEKIDKKFVNLKKGKYILATRFISKSNSFMKINAQSVSWQMGESRENSFNWFYRTLDIDSESLSVEIENVSGTNAVNVIALIPWEKWQEANQKTEDFIKNYKSIDIKTYNLGNTRDLPYKEVNPAYFEINTDFPGWIIFTDSYDKLWKLKSDKYRVDSIPVFADFNSFYVPKKGNFTLEFKGQDQVNIGIEISLISLVIFVLVMLLLT